MSSIARYGQKRVGRPGETPLNALVRGGIEYIEVRCVDVSPFSPVGLEAEQIRFLDTFLLYCLLQDSPPCDESEQAEQQANLEAVVNRGRQPGLALSNNGSEHTLQHWGQSLLDDMDSVAKLLDTAHGQQQYGASLARQRARVADPELTPSARVLREMREQDLPFFRLAMNYSLQWAEYFQQRPLPEEAAAALEQESRRSLEAQRDIEASDNISFEQYLENFFSQYQALQG